MSAAMLAGIGSLIGGLAGLLICLFYFSSQMKYFSSQMKDAARAISVSHQSNVVAAMIHCATRIEHVAASLRRFLNS